MLCTLGGSLLCCDGCPAAYHIRCLGEGPRSIPDGEWLCPECAVGGRGARPPPPPPCPWRRLNAHGADGRSRRKGPSVGRGIGIGKRPLWLSGLGNMLSVNAMGA